MVIKLSPKKKATKKGNRKNAASAEVADTLKMIKTSNQIASKEKPILGSKANKIPNDVATPFPPLNFKKIGNMCPNNIKNEEK